MKSGIYKIEHMASGKVYIGSAVNFVSRWNGHKGRLKHGIHHSPHLQSAWDKYGAAAFRFRKLLVCDIGDLIFWEQKYIDGYGACDREKGYNVAPTAGSPLGRKASEVTKAKMREKASRPRPERRGRPLPEATKGKIRAAHVGRVRSREEVEKSAAARRGAKRSGQALINIRTATNPNCKLDFAKATTIRDELAKGVSKKDLAERFEVPVDLIFRVASKRIWSRDPALLVAEAA